MACPEYLHLYVSHVTDVVITKTRLLKYIENFTSKKLKLSDEKLWKFSYFYSKHILSVLVKTASAWRFKRVSTIYAFEQKINVYPCTPQFYYINNGVKTI